MTNSTQNVELLHFFSSASKRDVIRIRSVRDASMSVDECDDERVDDGDGVCFQVANRHADPLDRWR